MDTVGEWAPIDSITPWERNPRTNDHAVQAVADSIQRFGWGNPILVRRADRVVIGGHTRLKAARLLGMDKVPVRLMDLDPAQAAALALADNKLGELADWDDEGLRDVIAELEADGIDLEGLGWSDEELSSLLAEPEPAPEPAEHTSDDDQTPAEAPAITQPGDVVTIGRHTLHCLDCIELLRSLPDNSIDAIVTDPPYGIGFMGKGWDSAVPGDVWAAECLRVLKPGGHIIAFAATRTVHRLAVNLEDAGFEIRDQICWLQWQGFPKSLDVSKAIDDRLGMDRKVVGEKVTGRARGGDNWRNGAAGGQETVNVTAPASPEAQRWDGWGTALKPAQEPAVLARKPLDGTVAANVLEHGTGGLNIDGCRYAYGDVSWPGPQEKPDDTASSWSSGNPGVRYGKLDYNAGGTWTGSTDGRWPANIYHCPKPSRGEREEGTEALPEQATPGANGNAYMGVDSAGKSPLTSRNIHPTVKPVRLMRWLVRLVTPPGGTVLETFGGSGTTLVAVEREGFTCIAAELEPRYCDIIRARLTYAVEGS